MKEYFSVLWRRAIELMRPRCRFAKDKAILYLSDIFGMRLPNAQVRSCPKFNETSKLMLFRSALGKTID